MKKVIFVDDESLIVQSFSQLIEMEEVEDKVSVETFTSKSCGKDTLKWVESNKPDIAVFDLILNGVSGIDIANKIMRDYPECKIIFLTGCEGTSGSVLKVNEMMEKKPDLMYYNKLDDNWYEEIVTYIIEQAND